MTEFIGEIFSAIFNGNVALATIVVSMIPIMELKGGIPFGMSEAFWGGLALSRWEAFWCAYLGCTIVSVVLYFTFVPIMKLLRKTKIFKGIAKFIDNRINKQTSKHNKINEVDAELSGEAFDKKEAANASQSEGVETVSKVRENESVKTKLSKARFAKVMGVLLFVSIPLPLTGVWMGTCLAVVLGLNFWETMASTIVGNLIAGIIISTICAMFPQFTHWLIYIFLILVIILIIAGIIKNKIIKNRQESK